MTPAAAFCDVLLLFSDGSRISAATARCMRYTVTMGRRRVFAPSANGRCRREEEHMDLLICCAVLLAAVAVVFLSAWHELRTLDENAGSAMKQIGTHLSTRFDAVLALLEVAQGYAGDSMAALAEQLRLRRRAVDASSGPEDVRQQEQLLDDVLAAVSTTADRYPGLRADEAYSRLFGTSDCCEQMLRTSRLLYNDAVTRLNRAVRTFPTSLTARLCGTAQRAHWEA